MKENKTYHYLTEFDQLQKESRKKERTKSWESVEEEKEGNLTTLRGLRRKKEEEFISSIANTERKTKKNKEKEERKC